MPELPGNAALRDLLREPVVRRLAAVCGETEVHLVGGVLRDRLLGLASPDLDAVVAGRGEEIARRLAADLPARLVPLGGKDFAAYRLVAGELTLDLWDRGETSLRQDLERRDLTINAMALAARGGELCDPLGGRADLAARRLRATTAGSFTADALRVLRLARLLVQLPGFTAEAATVKLAREAAPLLPLVAAERTRIELGLLFAHPEASRGLALLAAIRLYPGLWLGSPGVGAGGRPAKVAIRDLEALQLSAAEVELVLAGVARTEGAAPAGLEAASSDRIELDLPTARLALTFLDLPPTPGGPAQALKGFRDGGYLAHAPADAAAHLLALAHLPRGATARRRFLHQAGRRWATAFCVAGARALRRGGTAPVRWRRELAATAAMARSEGACLFSPPRLLDGADVQDILGLTPGPEVGRALAALTAAQVDAKVHTREQAITWLRRHFSHQAQ
jgi:poly(A) polymerase